MPAEIQIRHCATLEEYEECVRLERSTWGDDIAVPSALFVVAHHTGGQVLGAFDGAKVAGFTLSLAGMRGSQPYLHSHMTAVLPDYQNQGVGRRLKLFQRHDALKRGIRLVEWTFDPLELKNAHFNLVRLGAVARRFIPNCYGVTQSPLHAGLPTDRLVAEWWLDSERVKSILADNPPPSKSAIARISLPANVGDLKASGRDAGARIQAEARGQFENWFAKGYVVVGIETRGDKTDYLLERASAVAGLDLPERNND